MTFLDWYGTDLTGQTFEGTLDCSCEDLTSLKGCPEVVNGGFDCSFNKLTSLKHSPKIVNGGFYCSGNEITSLEYGPELVEGLYYCYDNNLTSLNGICYSKDIVSDFPNKVDQEYLKEHYPERYV